MTSTQREYRLPNRGEVADLLLPTVRRLCREQPFVFEPKGKSSHPKLRNTETGEWTPLPTTLFDGPVRYKYEANLRRLGADLTFPQDRTRKSVVPPSFDDGMGQQTVDMPWTDTEWRELQRDEVWWRQRFAPDARKSEPEPEAAPEPPALSAYGRDLMGRLERGSVRPDARGADWTLAAARQLVKDGYSVDHAVNVSGWGIMWFADLA